MSAYIENATHYGNTFSFILPFKGSRNMTFKKQALLAAVLVVGSSSAMADNIGSCGWGSKVFDGQSGIGPQVLAATTNGTSGNQTFGISSGTSGCTQDGTVTSTWQTAMFIDGNKKALARDTAAGRGETLEALASLIGVEAQDKAAFTTLAQQNFARIFPTADVTAAEIQISLREVVAADETLKKYAAAI